MATSINGDEFVYRAFKLSVQGLRPFVEDRFKERYGESWSTELDKAVRERVPWQTFRPEVVLDAQALLEVIVRLWHPLFRDAFGGKAKLMLAYAHQLLAMRHHLAHWAPEHDFSIAEVESVLNTAMLLLSAIGAPQAVDVDRLKHELTTGRGMPTDAHGVGAGPEPPHATMDATPSSPDDDTETELLLHKGYMLPDSPEVIAFVDPREEDAYLQWVEHHASAPRGFVVNVPRQPSLFEMKIHKASCGFIKGVGKKLVGKDTFKVCSTNKDLLVSWIQTQPGKWSHCGSCKP